MTRRTFLRRVATAAAGVAVAPLLPLVPTPTLAFNPVGSLFNPAIDIARQYRVGVLSRYDVLYGFRAIRPDLACRVVG